MVAWSDEARESWLNTYFQSFSKELACQATGIGWRTQEQWYAEDPEWAERVDGVRKRIGDLVQAVLIERAMHGVPEQVVLKGQPLFEKDEDDELVHDERGDPIPVTYRRHDSKLLLAAAENLAGWGQREIHQVEIPRKEITLLDHEGNAMSLERLLKGHFKRLQKARPPGTEQKVIEGQVVKGNGKAKSNGRAKKVTKKKRKKSE